MKTNDDRDGDPAAWDRIGWMLEDMSSLAMEVSNRNRQLWSTVSENLRRDGGYTADALARDTALAMTAAVDNASDIWSFLTQAPQRESVATELPTAFLFICWAEDDQETFLTPDPLSIRVPGAVDTDLPDRAEIGLNGPDEQKARAVRKCLRATRGPGLTYQLEAYDVHGLAPGTYDGLVYLTDPPRALANLRVVVERQTQQ